MANNNNNKRSFFSEKRRSNDPNFFNRMDPTELKKYVKRIILDIKFDNIEDNDYSYFTNSKLLSVCIQESYQQFINNTILLQALNIYIDGINKGMIIPYNINITEARIISSNQQTAINKKVQNWNQIYNIFRLVESGSEIITTLKQIQNMSFNPNDI